MLGYVAYGLSVFLYVKVQKALGAAKTSAFYSLAPFLKVILSMVILHSWPYYSFYVALLVMIIAMVFVVKDKFISSENSA